MKKASNPLKAILSSTTPAAIEPNDGFKTPPLFETKKAARAEKVQLNLRISEQLRTRAKLKAIKERTTIEHVVIEFLEGWA